MIIDTSNTSSARIHPRSSSVLSPRRLKAKQRRLKEYRKLSTLVPSLATVVTPDSLCEDVSSSDEVVIVNETIKYIDHLQQRLLLKLKDPLFLEKLMSLETQTRQSLQEDSEPTVLMQRETTNQ